MEPVLAYQDRAVVIMSDGEGLPVSASTQPAMMAIMLRQLGLGPGHRVLEVGTGTGYNAALIACMVGSQESVVSIDVIPELIEQARANLTAARYAGVRVVCGDGAAGAPDYAPYDRMIVTTGAWDLPPEWWAQLRPGGRIVLPLSIRGIQLSVGLDNAGDHLVSGSACRCSFIKMAGAMIGPESLIALGPQPGLHAQAVDGPVPGANALYEAFSGPAAEEPTGLWASSIAAVADLDLWLTLTELGLTRLNLMGRHETQASPAQQPIANLMPLGGLAKAGDSNGLGVAAFNFKEDEIQPGSFKITPGLAKGEPAEEHSKARTMIDTLIRPASPNGATDGQTSTAVGGGARPGSPGMRRRPRGRLWALLHAQALLSGPTTDVVGIEDDWKRMAGRRAR